MSCQQSNMKAHGANASTPQKLVNQEPVYDRKLKVHRPRKRKNGPKWV